MSSKRPNIILCTADQLRPFELGCYGNPVVRTPHIDRLADEGARFETAITPFPICMAARSCMLSGQHNRRCTGGVSNVAFPGRPGEFSMPEYPDEGRPHLKDRTLPECLHDLGYHNAAIGKWHIHSWPNDVGFDDYLIPRVHHCHTGQSYTENGGPEFVPGGYSVDFEADRVGQFLRRRAGDDQPFFLFYNISPPHCPLADAPQKYLTMYRPDEIPLRPNVDLDVPLANQDYWFKVYRWDFRYYSLHLPFAGRLPEGYTLRHLIAEYCGLVSWVDDTMGRLLAALDATGLADDTLVVFTSDHGDSLGSNGHVQKGTPNDESIRIPLIARGPGIARRAIPGQVGSLVDLMPTLLELAGGESPAHVHGQSLAPVLRGEQDQFGRAHAFFETAGGVGVRSLSHTYTLAWAGEERRPEDRAQVFYDDGRDPYQLRNLAGSGEQGDVAARLDRALRDWDRDTPWMSAGEI